MSTSPLPLHLEELGNRRFSFYPPILGVEQNEWIYSRATWSEMLVINAATGAEIWVPRRFVGEVSRVDEPVLIVGLHKELEFKGGTVMPHQRRVVQMPRPPKAVDEQSSTEPAPVVSIRLEHSTDVKAGRMVVVVLVLGVVACSIIAGVARNSRVRPKNDFTQIDQTYLQLSRTDDYYSVVQKLGRPASERSSVAPGGLAYKALEYPNRHFTVILMGRTQAEELYLGTVDPSHRVLDSARFPGGGDGAAMLRALPGL